MTAGQAARQEQASKISPPRILPTLNFASLGNPGNPDLQIGQSGRPHTIAAARLYRGDHFKERFEALEGEDNDFDTWEDVTSVRQSNAARSGIRYSG